MLGARGRYPETAVAHHNRGDAVPRRRREVGIPQNLGVVVRVRIDETRCEHEALEIDDCGVGMAGRSIGAHGDDSITDDYDVNVACGCAGAIDHRGTSEHERAFMRDH
ncbi:unannotated protein [freshwater metagenome]|uniref:Unannotated protein n=1 Tax=freshwater metagenome TaxID=449393 RepID=A0A6J7AV66_9ZZZZ